MSISTDELVQRNAKFAGAGTFAGLPFPTNQTLRIVGCVDSRVDPSDVLGLALGDAVVRRISAGPARHGSMIRSFWTTKRSWCACAAKAWSW